MADGTVTDAVAHAKASAAHWHDKAQKMRKAARTAKGKKQFNDWLKYSELYREYRLIRDRHKADEARLRREAGR